MPPIRTTPRIIVPGHQAYIEGRPSRSPSAPPASVLHYRRNRVTLGTPFDTDGPARAACLKAARQIIRQIDTGTYTPKRSTSGKQPQSQSAGDSSAIGGIATIDQLADRMSGGAVMLSDALETYMRIRLRPTDRERSDPRARRRHAARFKLVKIVFRSVFIDDFQITNERLLAAVTTWLANPTGPEPLTADGSRRRYRSGPNAGMPIPRRPIAAATLHPYLAPIRAFLRFCRAMNWTTMDLVHLLPKLEDRQRPDPRHYTRDDCAAILCAARQLGAMHKDAPIRHGRNFLQLPAFIQCLIYSGLRIGELVALRWEEYVTDPMQQNYVTASSIVLTNTKTLDTGDDPRIIPYRLAIHGRHCFPSLISALDGQRRHAKTNHGFVFPWRDQNSARVAVKRVVAMAGVHAARMPLHVFRGMAGIAMLRRGFSKKTVTDILGNSPDILDAHYLERPTIQQLEAELAEQIEADLAGRPTVAKKSQLRVMAKRAG